MFAALNLYCIRSACTIDLYTYPSKYLSSFQKSEYFFRKFKNIVCPLLFKNIYIFYIYWLAWNRFKILSPLFWNKLFCRQSLSHPMTLIFSSFSFLQLNCKKIEHWPNGKFKSHYVNNKLDNNYLNKNKIALRYLRRLKKLTRRAMEHS